jgi:hypothetical protein
MDEQSAPIALRSSRKEASLNNQMFNSMLSLNAGGGSDDKN